MLSPPLSLALCKDISNYLIKEICISLKPSIKLSMFHFGAETVLVEGSKPDSGSGLCPLSYNIPSKLGRLGSNSSIVSGAIQDK